jgi:hypothetical protein
VQIMLHCCGNRVTIYIHGQGEENKMTTTTFETGSEFRVSWETERPNPRYTRYNRQHQYIITQHKSEIFASYDEAQAFNVSIDKKGTVQVRRPGMKNFIPTYQAKSVKV